MKYDLFDTHAHYTDKRFETEHEGGAEELLRALFADEVGTIINVATDVDNALEVIAQAKKFEGVYAAVGIHPMDCKELPDVDTTLADLEALLIRRKDLKIVALGEIGLDYYWDADYKELQQIYFERQLELAIKYDLPVLIHDREAHGDSFETVLRYPDARGVFHSFSGSPELATELTRRGWYISFSGVISFKNARKSREVAAVVPVDKILIETDCPYLAPHPFRGKLNRSDYLKYTMEALADARNEDVEALSETVFQNSLNFFSI